MLKIKNLTVFFNEKKLLDDVSLDVTEGSRHLLRGRNGSGKTTLAQVIAGNPDYRVESGTIEFMGRDIVSENATTRSLLGIFLGGQNVPEIPGLSVLSFLKHSAAAHYHFNNGRDLAMGMFLQNLESARARLDIPKEWLNRSVNVGFSGGERKRLMFLRLLITQPKLAILDEPDSGADASAQKLFAEIMNEMSLSESIPTTFIFISHQDKFTELVNPNNITTLENGKIVI